MNAANLLELTYQMLMIVLLLSLPVVITSVLIGFVVGLLQAVTQIQDQSIAYGIKLIGAIIVIALTAAWAGGELLVFARAVFQDIGNIR